MLKRFRHDPGKLTLDASIPGDTPIEMDEPVVDEVEADGASSEGGTVADPSQVPEGSSMVADGEGKSTDPPTDDANPATDDAATDVAPPAKRKSHRPSLEVVEVKVDSFYDKTAFKQELQVRWTKMVCLLCRYLGFNLQMLSCSHSTCSLCLNYVRRQGTVSKNDIDEQSYARVQCAMLTSNFSRLYA